MDINIATLRFLKDIEELTEKSKSGFVPLNKANDTHVIFDQNSEHTCPFDEGNAVRYRIVRNYMETDNKPETREVISYYGKTEGVNMYLLVDENNCTICIDFSTYDHVEIKDGQWYFTD